MSPKNKGKFGKGKTAVEPDDEFVTTMSRVGRALEPHVKKIFMTVVGVTALLVMVFWWRHCNTVEEQKATTLYAEATTLSNVPVLPPPPASDDAGDAAGDATGDATGQAQDAKAVSLVTEDANNDTIPDSYPSKTHRARAVLDKLDRLDARHGSTEVAKSARMLRASMLFDLGEYQAAYDTYRKVLSSDVPRQVKLLAREGMGHASEALAMNTDDQAKRTAALQQALESYRSIQPASKEPDWDRALYHVARIQAELGQVEEAKTTLRQALEDMPEGAKAGDIKQYLAQLEATGK